MQKIKDLNPDQLAQLAHKSFIESGRNYKCARLIYRCLELDPQHALGLRCLSDFLDWRGSEPISAVILEHLLDNGILQNIEEIVEHQRLWLICKFVWGFSKHNSGETQLAPTAFDEPADFEIDSEAYQAFVQRAIDAAGSREQVLKGAVNMIGIYGDNLLSPSLAETATPLDTLKLDDFVLKPDYGLFLEESSADATTTD